MEIDTEYKNMTQTFGYKNLHTKHNKHKSFLFLE